MAPTLRRFASELYEALTPAAYSDEENDWALARLCQAVGAEFEPLEEIVRDTDDGPGWSSILDIERVPDEWLDFLAQFNGTVVSAGGSASQKRMEIRDERGFKRGTPASLIAAAKSALTGPEDEKRVTLVERDGSAYALTVITYEAQTPDADAVVQAILKVKPAGLVLTHEVRTGWTYDDMRDFYVGQTIDDADADFPDYDHLRDRLP